MDEFSSRECLVIVRSYVYVDVRMMFVLMLMFASYVDVLIVKFQAGQVYSVLCELDSVLFLTDVLLSSIFFIFSLLTLI